MSTYNNPLEVLISPSDLPDSFGVIKDGLQSAFSNVFFRDFTAFRNEFDNTSHYQLTLIIQKLLKVEVPGVDGLALSLNPDYQAGDQTAIPISLEYQWKVFERIRDFDFSTFDGGIRSIFGLLLDVLGLDEEVLLIQFIDRFFGRDEDPDLDSIAGFVADFNQKVNPPTPLSVPAGTELYDAVISILEQLNTNGNSIDLVEILFTEYFDGADFEDKINELIRGLAQPITVAGFLDNIKPYVAAAIESINLALEFPRTWLQPVDANGDVIQDQSIPSRLRFNAGRAFFSTTSGFGFESLGSFDLTPSQIGNTGLIISLTGLKVDLSTDNSIPEALADGRGNAFKGIFAEEASITLPKKWFDPNQNHPDTTAQVVGRDLLIGTGGISGQIALEAIGSVPEPVLVKQLGGDGFEIGFKSFDINFNRGSVSSSNIAGYLKIPKLEDTNGNPAQIDIQGHLDGDGDFRISASEKDGFAPLRIPNVMDITIRSLAIGSEDGDFYLEIGCKVKFTNAIMSKVLGDQELEIPQLRIYSDGSFEIVGGTIPIPANLTLDLGPVLVAITGINYGSYQQEYNGTMRKYNRWGFDGAISLGPLGVEARGKGMEYYYTVDGGAFHSYFRIKAIEVDIIIPAQATPATATAIINGYLTIPQPGDSQEFTGGVKLQLPKARISGSAEMRMIPKYPAFIVDAEISLPKPIPIASTGLGIYGFRGLLGYRYVAEKEAVGLTSGEDSWYDYYTYPPRGVDISKFSSPDQTENYNNPVSVGAGATLATAGDDGTILSTRLFLLLSLPSVFILEGKASIISKRLKLDDTQEPPFFAFMAYGDNSIEVGMGADFQLPQSNGWIVDLFANVEAGFFFNNPSAWYINFGRKDAPISARMLTLFTAQTYLQLSAKGIEAGARAEFKFNKKFGPARVKAWLYVEVGGFISFERPQFGGYLAAGGGLEVKIWIIKAGVSFDALLAVEAAKPFLIYAKVRVCAKVRIGFIKVRKCATVELKWEKSKQIDDSPIAPLLADRADELVKGVHMLSGQSFNLVRLNSNIENTYTPGAPGSNFNNAIVPLDTYVDIQFTKGLLPNAVSSQIGGVNHPPEQYTDLIPPQKTVRGGKQVRQVTHRYSIENLTVKAWSNGEWVHYHPFEALTAGQATNSNFGDLKIGQWQKSSKTYNAIRLMATSPFSYTEQGQPGWFIPEQTGITPATLYCEGQTRSSGCADWLDKPWARQYPTEVPFRAKGTYITVTSGSTVDQSQVEIAGSDYSFVSSASNPHGFAQSLAFDNYKKAAV
ncbi:MAG TPA: hypothetical protein DCE41_36390, partial [Cytophagales bacterium]|nr:hypothetical protein [Cytophagales bacterium]